VTAWQPAYVGIGSNLGDPVGQIRRAFEALDALPETRLLARSPSYVSRPFGPIEQPDFCNAVAGLLTRLPLAAFFALLEPIEAALGRGTPHLRWGPREIDLDLLVFGTERVDSPLLQVPHPGIVGRDFVLYPLRDIAADLEIPGLGRVRELAARVPDRGISRIG
jgi:2-amino-4-hydroxy-6-hydroxymethyldihydropteridine diphosphokinase